MNKLPYEKIKAKRKELKISQQLMANSLGVSQMAYSKIERNKTQLNWVRLNEIAKLLSIDIWDLVDDKSAVGKNEDKKSPEEVVLLLKQLFHKHDYQIKSLKEEVNFLREQLEKKK